MHPAARAISPPSASTSRTRWPLPDARRSPDCSSSGRWFRYWCVINRVRPPVRAAARAASVPSMAARPITDNVERFRVAHGQVRSLASSLNQAGKFNRLILPESTLATSLARRSRRRITNPFRRLRRSTGWRCVTIDVAYWRDDCGGRGRPCTMAARAAPLGTDERLRRLTCRTLVANDQAISVTAQALLLQAIENDDPGGRRQP